MELAKGNIVIAINASWVYAFAYDLRLFLAQ
jgi:hypothetical protein